MPVFTYKASDQLGRRSAGSLTSDTVATARELLRRKGLRPSELRQAQFGSRHGWGWPYSRAKHRERTSEFARQLSMLLRSGIPLVEALDILIGQFSGSFRTVVQDIRDRVSAGIPLHDAMEVHPTWFDVMYRSAVSVGQRSGRMEQALRNLSEYENERATLRTRLLTALAYPCILCVMGIAVVLFLMSYVVPQLLTILEDAGQALPAPTRILKGLSDFLTGHWAALCGTGLVVATFFFAVLQCRGGRRWLQNLQLGLPLLGALIRKTLVAQFAQMMALLLQNGVSFLDALRLIRTSTNHLVLVDELAEMEAAIQRGSDIAPTLAESRIFPPLVVHVVNVGQKAGELTEMLQQLKEGYEMEVRLAVGKFAAALEPMLIVVMSAVVGFVVFATMLPILETTRSIR